jgi:tRNA dimethylallyltransferase
MTSHVCLPASGSPPAPFPAWYLTGPTAVGKSAIALELAERVGGEIISVDSMQVYRGLDIGTAKPSAAEQARVRHHLIDVAGLDETFDAARFANLAQAVEAEVRSRGRVPVYCGGTGFYLKALWSGLGEAPVSDPSLRAELEALPLAELLRELELKDPIAFARIDRRNPRRVVRAVEVIRLTGRPFSAQAASPATGEPVPQVFAFTREPADLRQRIDRRVDQMFADGLVEEARQLLRRGLADNRTALQAIGYRQVVEHLNGERPLADTVALVKTRTWQFARRQLTWLRHQMCPHWIMLDAGSGPMEVVARLMETSVGGGARKK